MSAHNAPLVPDLSADDTLQVLSELENELQRDPSNKEVEQTLRDIYRGTMEGLHREQRRAGVADSVAAFELLEVWLRKLAALPSKRTPAHVEVLFELVLNLHYQGKQAEAIQVVDEALRLQEELAAEHPLGASGIRFFQTRSGTAKAIGHLIAEPEFFVKTGALGWRPPFHGVVLLPKDDIINPSGLEYWRPYVTAVTDPSLIRRFAPIAKRLEHNTFWFRLPNGQILYYWSGFIAVQREWDRQGRPPVVRLRDEHRERGRRELEKFGIPRDAWFVTLHVRDQRRGKFGVNIHGQSTNHRDVEIETYVPAIQEIVRRGGWVVRMGDISMKPAPKIPGLVDIVGTDSHTDWMDIFLVAGSRFFFGTASGPNCIPLNFGVPSLITNSSPMNIFAVTKDDIYLPKLMRSRKTGQLLTFQQGMGPPFNHAFNSDIFEHYGAEVIDNTPEELLEVTKEMLDRLEGKCAYSADDEALQERFRTLVQRQEPLGLGSRIGRDFLKRHQQLL